MSDLEKQLADLLELKAKATHAYKDGPLCGFDSGKRICGQPHDKGRHVRYGPDWEKPGYHEFEPEQVHDVENCFACAAVNFLASLPAWKKEVEREALERAANIVYRQISPWEEWYQSIESAGVAYEVAKQIRALSQRPGEAERK